MVRHIHQRAGLRGCNRRRSLQRRRGHGSGAREPPHNPASDDPTRPPVEALGGARWSTFNQRQPSVIRDVMAGWGGRDRTSECRYQKPVPYHLATPQLPGFLLKRHAGRKPKSKGLYVDRCGPARYRGACEVGTSSF
jgi:hypothetical protein